jgi:hypothetical protein
MRSGDLTFGGEYLTNGRGWQLYASSIPVHERYKYLFNESMRATGIYWFESGLAVGIVSW